LEGESYSRYFVAESTQALTSDLEVNYALGGTATPGVDYTISGGTVNYSARTGTVTIPAGTEAFAGTDDLITLHVTADNISDGNETITFRLVDGTDYDITVNILYTFTLRDRRELAFSATAVTVSEDAGASYTVSLDTEPTEPVTVAIASNNRAVTVRPTSLTFTPDNWNQPQEVTVTAGQGGTARLRHTASGGDYYDGVTGTVTVRVARSVASSRMRRRRP